jgi:HK97 family phage prohead protease
MNRHTRLAPSSAATTEVDTASRVVRYVFSDESVGRDGHVVKASAWQTDNFELNPVFLWAHLDTEPPIGRVFDLNTVQRTLRGSVKYAETEFADSIFQLVRDKYLNAVSTSWMPIDWQQRDGASAGLIFTSVDLLEISQVPVPALPSALAEARGRRRINLRPIANWAERALDSRIHGLDRSHLEAIRRAACGSSARATRTRGLLHQITEAERRIYERYQQLRDGYGFTIDQAAWDAGIDAHALRTIIARVVRTSCE